MFDLKVEVICKPCGRIVPIDEIENHLETFHTQKPDVMKLIADFGMWYGDNRFDNRQDGIDDMVTKELRDWDFKYFREFFDEEIDMAAMDSVNCGECIETPPAPVVENVAKVLHRATLECAHFVLTQSLKGVLAFIDDWYDEEVDDVEIGGGCIHGNRPGKSAATEG